MLRLKAGPGDLADIVEAVGTFPDLLGQAEVAGCLSQAIEHGAGWAAVELPTAQRVQHLHDADLHGVRVLQRRHLQTPAFAACPGARHLNRSNSVVECQPDCP